MIEIVIKHKDIDIMMNIIFNKFNESCLKFKISFIFEY